MELDLRLEQLLIDLFITAGQFGVLALVCYGFVWLFDFILMRLKPLPAMARLGDLERIRGAVRRVILIGFLLLAAGLLIFNTTLVIRGIPVFAGTVDLLRTSIPPGFWTRLGIGLGLVALLVVVTRFVIRLLQRWIPALEQRIERIEVIKTSERQVRAFFSTLLGIVQNGLWVLVAGLSAQAVGLPDVVAETIFIGLRIYLIVAVGRLIVSVLGTVLNVIDSLSERYIRSVRLDDFYTHLRGLLPLFSRTLEFIIYVGAVTLAMSQIPVLREFTVYGGRIIQVIGLVFLSRVAVEVVHVFIERFFLVREPHMNDGQWQQRLTFGPLLKSASQYAVYFGAILLVLMSLGFDIGPVLVGLGGIGLVVGLAAQPVTTDLISGLFILFENLFLVGDYIETGNARGTVESIDVRTTRIRDPDGQLHLVRNGQIGDIVNYSKGYVYAVVLISVADTNDVDRVFAVIDITGRGLDTASEDVLEPTVVQGIEEFGDDLMVIRTMTRVKPGKHQQVARELRRVLKQAFDEAGIAMSAPASHVAQVVLSPRPLNNGQQPTAREAGA